MPRRPEKEQRNHEGTTDRLTDQQHCLYCAYFKCAKNTSANTCNRTSIKACCRESSAFDNPCSNTATPRQRIFLILQKYGPPHLPNKALPRLLAPPTDAEDPHGARAALGAQVLRQQPPVVGCEDRRRRRPLWKQARPEAVGDGQAKLHVRHIPWLATRFVAEAGRKRHSGHGEEVHCRRTRGTSSFCFLSLSSQDDAQFSERSTAVPAAAARGPQHLPNVLEPAVQWFEVGPLGHPELRKRLTKKTSSLRTVPSAPTMLRDADRSRPKTRFRVTGKKQAPPTRLLLCHSPSHHSAAEANPVGAPSPPATPFLPPAVVGRGRGKHAVYLLAEQDPNLQRAARTREHVRVAHKGWQGVHLTGNARSVCPLSAECVPRGSVP